MGETLAKDQPTMPQPFFGSQHFLLDVLHIKTTNIFEFNAFEQIPDLFLWVRLWCVARQTHQMDAFAHRTAQKLLGDIGTVNGRSLKLPNSPMPNALPEAL